MPLNPSENQSPRSVLRVLGPTLMVCGGGLMALSIWSFFSSFGTFEPPKYFWCAFLGVPLLAVGAGITKFAYFGAVARYMANEVAPVGKDVVNYMANGTKGAVREVATAVGEGLRGDVSSPANTCPKCNEANDADANFCKSCGGPLTTSITCEACGEENDHDARFCDNCGKPLGS